MRLREVAKATGLDEDTIRRLERKGVIHAERDANGHRIFDASVVKLLRERYKDRMQPKTTPQYDLKIAEAKPGERCPGCGGPLAIKGTLHATQGVDALDVFSDVCSKLMQFGKERQDDDCRLVDAWFHRTQGEVFDYEGKIAYVRQESPDDSLRHGIVMLCQRATLIEADGSTKPCGPAVMLLDDLLESAHS